MKSIKSIVVAALVLAAMLVAGNSAAKDEVSWTFGNTTQDTRVTGGSLSAAAGDEVMVVVGLPDFDCANFVDSGWSYSPSSSLASAKILPCEQKGKRATLAMSGIAAKTNGTRDITFSYAGYTSPNYSLSVTTPYPAAEEVMTKKEHQEDIDDLNDKFDGLAPFEQRVQITLGLLTGPNMYDEEAGVARGFHLALGVKPLDRSNKVAQLKLQALMYYRHQSVYVNPNLSPTNLDSTEDQWFWGIGALWSPEWGWGEFNVGGRVGATMWQYPDTEIVQHTNLIVEEENQVSTWTLDLQPVIGINFFPHENIVLGLEGWGSYNVMPINRYVGNDGEPNGHKFLLSAAFLAGVRL